MFDDVYHRVLETSWWAFFGGAALGFVALNIFFAALYALPFSHVVNVHDFEDAFYFSVQTLATVGYGVMAPENRFAHMVSVVEALVGILGTAVITGVTFAKFSRPTARVLFAEKCVVAERNGVPHLMFRMANWRHNSLVEASLSVILLALEKTSEGETMRVPIEVKLVRNKSPVFQFTWSAMHKIDETSPFHGADAIAKLREQDADLYLSLAGLDETSAQTIHARYRYRLDDIVWNAHFTDVISLLPDGTRTIDYTKFHEVVKRETTSPA